MRLTATPLIIMPIVLAVVVFSNGVPSRSRRLLAGNINLVK